MNFQVIVAQLLPCHTVVMYGTITLLKGCSLRNTHVGLIWLELILNSRKSLPDGSVPDECLTLYK